jgi:probable F420-dependent oxidoreductase
VRIGANLITNDTTLSILDVAPRVEAAGLDSIFQGEHSHIPVATVFPAFEGVVPDFYKRFPDLFVTMAAAAAVTTRLRLGTGVVLVAEHQPLRLAKAVASLDRLSGGRVDFGVGYGWNAPEMANNGVEPARRGAVFREHLGVIRDLWSGDVVDHDGDHVSFTPSWSLPKPVQTASRPGPPILIGAGATRRTFKDVLELADGWYPLTGPTLVEDAARLRAAAAEQGRDVEVSACEMAGQMAGVPWYCDDTAARQDLADAVQRYADGGIDRLLIGVPVDTIGHLEDALAVLAELQPTAVRDAVPGGAGSGDRSPASSVRR